VTTTPALAAILSTGEPERLYSGLSALVSTAAGGPPCAALAAFGALDLILDPALGRRVTQHPDATPSLSGEGRETFARSLPELVAAALALDTLTIHACAASVETMAIDRSTLDAQLDGVKSTPRFLRDTAGARLIFV
jgi:hypothetical protein